MTTTQLSGLKSARRLTIPPESERQFQNAVLELAQIMRWRIYHPWTSVHSQAGWPDAALIRPPRFVVAEFKRVGKKPTTAQQAWLDDFKACGIEAYWWTAQDWQEIKRVLA